MAGKFGIQQPSHTVPEGENQYKRVEQVAVEAEKLGFDSFWVMDHFIQIPIVGSEQEPILEGWTTIAALAAKTSKIRLGTMVTSNVFRNPAHLAKMGATVDVISGGRLIMGMGAGYHQREFEGYGFLPSSTRAERIRRLEEAVQIIDKMWTEEAPDFQGRFYSISKAICNPKPIQKPRPPIMIGGGGEQLTLRVVARYADMCNLFGDPPAVRHKLEVLERHCGEVGRDPKSILKTRLGPIIIASNEASLEKAKERALSGGRYFAGRPEDVITGTPQQCIEICGKLFEAGMDYLIFNFPNSFELEPLQLFAQEVVPAFR